MIGAYVWWNSPERQIRRVLTAVAEGVTHDAPREGLSAVSAAAGLQEYFAADVVIDPGRPFSTLKGRDALLAAAGRIATTPALSLEFVDTRIELAGDGRSAVVNCTAVARFRDRNGAESVDAREVVMTMSVVDGRWVITAARAVDVLEPVT
jgi:hypothetical protein